MTISRPTGAAATSLMRRSSPARPRRRITVFDRSAAETGPGLLRIFTHRDFADAIAPVPHLMSGGCVNSAHRPLASHTVAYAD